MGVESPPSRGSFGLEELGLFDTTPLKPLDTIVDLCAEAIDAPVVAFLVFDDNAASMVIKSIIGGADVRPGPIGVQAERSACDLVRREACGIGISNLSARAETAQVFERRKLGAIGFLAAPVHGPDGAIIGVLAAMTPSEHHWTRHEKKRIENYAYLLSEQVMFRAALQTVKILSREFSPFGKPVRFRN